MNKISNDLAWEIIKEVLLTQHLRRHDPFNLDHADYRCFAQQQMAEARGYDVI